MKQKDARRSGQRRRQNKSQVLMLPDDLYRSITALRSRKKTAIPAGMVTKSVEGE
jgi:hypothetical protein